jgi:protein MpaA
MSRFPLNKLLLGAALAAQPLLMPQANAQMAVADSAFGGKAFTPIAFVSPATFASSLVASAQKDDMIRDFCATMRGYYKRYKWTDEPCGKVKWKADLRSKEGHPLIYAEFGASAAGAETTLFLGGVHADELTPMHLAFRMARFLDEHPEVMANSSRVILAPLVNPDGFLRQVPTRTNSNGIDLNRNFFTMDWYDKAHKEWQDRRQRLLAHFPGYFPNSEVETIFQIQMIDRFKPDKILSIHAPLGFLDYDGPGSNILRPLTLTEAKAKRLVKAVSESSKNYKVVDFTFYPGSLGNYAGIERKIPTVTLELQTTEPTKVDTYWQQFQPGLLKAIQYPFVRTPALEAQEGSDNASPFSAQYCADPNRTI